MTILGIETSCDETAVSVVEGRGGLRAPRFRILAHIVSSQIKIHAPYGGVVPMLAKREHEKNLVPVLKKALGKAQFLKPHLQPPPQRRGGIKSTIPSPWGRAREGWRKILAREPELLEPFLKFLPTIAIPKIDALAVTSGPGLEPALWAGVNFARALALAWRKKLIPINHIEGHIYSVLIQNSKFKTQNNSLKFPALALLISGGHTELVLMTDWFKYRVIGQTRDDAVGECFDKVARLLGLPYPGGPALSKLAAQVLKDSPWRLPRPMINSPNLDFSFSGLKTAVRYLLENKRSDLKETQGPTLRGAIAAEFQQAVIDVLLAKTAKAIVQYQPVTLIIAGGVSANQPLRRQFTKYLAKHHPAVKLLLPEPKLTMDNATMIAMAGYLRLTHQRPFKVEPLIQIKAHGNLALS